MVIILTGIRVCLASGPCHPVGVPEHCKKKEEEKRKRKLFI